MKFNYFIVCFACFLISISSFGQTKIKLKWENGWHTIPCSVNGLPLRAIYDSKVAVVNISASEAMFLLRNGYLQKEDIINTKKKSTNDLIEVGTSEIVIRTLDIGGLKLTNIKASVVKDMGAPMLFGQSLLTQLGYVQTIDGELVISKEPIKQPNPQQIQQTEQQQVQQPQQAQQFSQQAQQPVSGEHQTVSVYKDDNIELSIYTDIQYEINNHNLYHVWVRREYFGNHKKDYINAFEESNQKEIENKRLVHKKKNQYFDPYEYHIDFENFRYNWALYVFDFSNKRFKMARLTHYDNRGNIIKDTGYNFDASWDLYAKSSIRMKTVYDNVYKYLF